MKDTGENDDIFEWDYEKIRKLQPFEDEPDSGREAAATDRRASDSDRRAAGSRRRTATSEASRKTEAPSAGRSRKKDSARRRRRRILTAVSLLLALVLGLSLGLGGGYFLWGYERPYTVDLKVIKAPDWITQDFIRKNIFSRPDVTMKQVNNIVIHYVANPNSTAEYNRRYFDNLADQDPEQGGTSASSHFIVGLDGEILQCIPISEIAYANAPRNNDTVSIEVCHPDETGKFNEETYDSLVRLTAWLCTELELKSSDVIRHYDVSGKNCPKYFVEHEDAWRQFLSDVKAAIKEEQASH